MARAAQRLLTRDVVAGLVFLAVGLLGLAAGRGLEIGPAGEMGVGYVPRLVSLLLVGLGALITAIGAVKGSAPVGRLAWRPALMVTLATLGFAATLERFGAIVAVVIAVVLASFAGEQMNWRALVLTAGVLALAVVAIFLWGLGLPVRALPRFEL